MVGRRWSKDEDKKLLQLRAEGKIWKEIAQALNRSVYSVVSRYSKALVKKKSGNHHYWTDYELQVLKENYPDLKKVAVILKRTYASVRYKALDIFGETEKQLDVKQDASICFDCKNALKCPWVLWGKKVWDKKREDGVVEKCKYFIPEEEGCFSDNNSGIVTGERED